MVTLHAFLVALAVASVGLVLVVSAVGVYLVGCYSMYGEYPPCDGPRCAPSRGELLERGRTEDAPRVRHLPPPVPLTPTEAADIAMWESELQ